MKQRIVQVYNLEAYPVSALPLWKRLILPHIRVEIAEAEGVTLQYKMLLGSMYITKIIRTNEICNSCDTHRGRFN